MALLLRISSSQTWALSSWLLLAVLASPLAHGQGACSSDDQSPPTALFERFTNASCATCWQDPATLPAPAGALALDWIVPGNQGDNAPLAESASTEALARLLEWQETRPATQTHQSTAIASGSAPGLALQVAHGPAVADYMGVLVTLKGDRNYKSPVYDGLILNERSYCE